MNQQTRYRSLFSSQFVVLTFVAICTILDPARSKKPSIPSEGCNVTVEISTVLAQNITLLYDSLDLQAIDSSELKKFMGSQAKPMVMDMPEMIVVVYPAEPLVIQMGDRRTRITLQQGSHDIGELPLWEIALKCNQLVAKTKSTLVAYGFNYDVGVILTSENANEAVLDLFISDSQVIEDALEGHILSFVPRLIFQQDQTRYDLVLEPMAEQRIKVHLNAHFEFEGIVLPHKDQLKASFHEEFEYLASILPRLFKEEK